jgi:hypothetical protein
MPPCTCIYDDFSRRHQPARLCFITFPTRPKFLSVSTQLGFAGFLDPQVKGACAR